MSEEKGFIEYVKRERQNFTNSQWKEWLLLSPDKRVMVENLLIAYDQMVDKLSQPYSQSGWISVKEADDVCMALTHYLNTLGRYLEEKKDEYSQKTIPMEGKKMRDLLNKFHKIRT